MNIIKVMQWDGSRLFIHPTKITAVTPYDIISSSILVQ